MLLIIHILKKGGKNKRLPKALLDIEKWQCFRKKDFRSSSDLGKAAATPLNYFQIIHNIKAVCQLLNNVSYSNLQLTFFILKYLAVEVTQINLQRS